jgi:hypothetical protein
MAALFEIWGHLNNAEFEEHMKVHYATSPFGKLGQLCCKSVQNASSSGTLVSNWQNTSSPEMQRRHLFSSSLGSPYIIAGTTE